jgi:DNA (cytosine-5)-methyltransferase 1
LAAKHRVPAFDVLRGLPRLRSGLSRTPDSREGWRAAVATILTAGVLKDIPNRKGAQIRADIRSTLERFRDPRADRGGEFVESKIRSDYRPDWYCDDRIGGVCNHISRPHIVADLHRYLFAACFARLFGRSPELRDFPPGLLPQHKNVFDKNKQEFFDDRFRVQLTDKPATTITSHIAKDGHYYIHFDETQCRTLTVREAARLQTFPDNYLFCGFRTEQYVQVGNAVPPLLAHQIAAAVAQVLRTGVAASALKDAHREATPEGMATQPLEATC